MASTKMITKRLLGLVYGGELNGYHVLGILFLFFGTIIAVNVALAIAATGTFPGLVVDDSYVASQHYNSLLADSRRQARRGWSADVSAPDGLLHVRLTDPSGAPLTGLRLSALVGRPASAREDHIVSLRPMADGYTASDVLAPGRWLVELKAWSGRDLVYRAKHPFFVGGAGS